MHRLTVALVSLLVLTLVALKWERGYGFTPLLRVSETWYARAVPELRASQVKVEKGTGGYDGQFYAQVALDPSLSSDAYASALDNPTYRAKRILVPATAWALGFGKAGVVLQLYALLNVAAWLAFAWLLAKELPEGPSVEKTARWVAVVLSVGVLESVRQSLVDLPALLLLLLCVRATKSGKTGIFWAMLGMLCKETQFLGIAASYSKRFPPRRLIWLLAVVALPFAVWSGFVLWRFREAPAAANLGQANFAAPFVAIALAVRDQIEALLSGRAGSREIFGLIAVFSFFVQGVTLLKAPDKANPWARVGLAYAGLGVLLGTAVWGGYWAAYRALLPLCLAFNLVLAPGKRFWLLWVAGNLPLLHGVWRFL